MRRGEDHWPEAETWLREVVERNPTHEHSRVELARLLMRRGEDHWPEAETWLREAVERNPTHAPSRVELARLLMRRGEDHWPEAETWLREAVERNPTNEHSRVELARLLMRRGEDHWPEAETWLREAVERNPTNEHSRVELSRLLVRQQHISQAICLLEEFIGVNEKTPHASALLTRLLEGDLSGSEKAISEILPESDQSFERDGYAAFAPLSLGRDSVDIAAPSLFDDVPAPMGGVPAAASLSSKNMDSIKHRARLQTYFMRTQSSMYVPREEDDKYWADSVAKGDSLAGFYFQWRQGTNGENRELPPNAWAQRACRLYQTRCTEQKDWQDLKQACRDKSPYTNAIQWLASEQPEEDLKQMGSWITRAESHKEETSSLDNYIVSTYKGLSQGAPQPQRDAAAFAILSAGAADVPQFSVTV